MSDPLIALKSLQSAYIEKSVELQTCALYPQMQVLLDYPNGVSRFTYAKL